MKTRIISMGILAFVLLPLCRSEALEQGRTGNGDLRIVDGVFVLRVWGTPRQRGVAHGMLVARDFVEGMNEAFKAGVLTRKQYEGRIIPLVKTAFAWPDHVMEEIRGILDGINLVLKEDQRRIPALDRELGLDDLLAINTLGDWSHLSCSTVSLWGGATDGGRTLVGRNFDFILPPKMAKAQIVLAEEASDGRFAFHTVAFPGTVGGITCLNEKGVFGSIHDVHVIPKGPLKGCTPRLTVLRLIAEKASAVSAVEDALAICREHKTLYGNNFHVAAPSSADSCPRAGVIEYDSDLSRDRGATLRSAKDGTCLICTNHFLARSEPFAQCPRYRALEEACELLSGQSVKITLESMKTLIAESEVAATMHQVVADLDEKTVCVAFQKTLGIPASRSGFSTLRWKDVFPKN